MRDVWRDILCGAMISIVSMTTMAAILTGIVYVYLHYGN